jgi:hypothetical protein
MRSLFSRNRTSLGRAQSNEINTPLIKKTPGISEQSKFGVQHHRLGILSDADDNQA